MDLTLLTAPDPAIRARLVAMIDRYNDDATDRREPVQHLTIPLRDAAGDVEGGLVGISYYDWMIVEMLFVPVGLRGHGIGARLMRAAEAIARDRGCTGIWLDTGSPDARKFYARLGYSEFATLPDQPAGYPRHFLMRTTLRPGDTAGLEVHAARLPEAAAIIARELNAVGAALMGDPKRETLAILAGESGGLWMRTNRDWLFLDLLILDGEARRSGTGTRILAMAESAARARNCTGIWLDTYGFQAPSFYRRRGYTEIGTLPNYPTPHARHFLAKRFAG